MALLGGIFANMDCCAFSPRILISRRSKLVRPTLSQFLFKCYILSVLTNRCGNLLSPDVVDISRYFHIKRSSKSSWLRLRFFRLDDFAQLLAVLLAG